MWAKEIQKIKEGFAHILFYHSRCPIVSTERRTCGIDYPKSRCCYICGERHNLYSKKRNFLSTTDYTGRIYCNAPHCIEAHKENRKREAEENRKELRARWYQEHKKEVLSKQRERRHSNAEKDKAWKAAHKEQINQHIRERKQADPIYKLKCQARTTIYKSFARTGNVKSERCEKLVGLSMDEFVAYLKRTYEQTYGRPWDGVGDVHIDHIVPLATAQTEEDVKRLCNYTNLRLITAEDNQRKGAKLDYTI